MIRVTWIAILVHSMQTASFLRLVVLIMYLLHLLRKCIQFLMSVILSFHRFLPSWRALSVLDISMAYAR